MEGAGAEERALGQGAAVADFAMEPVPAIALSGEVCGVRARMMLDSGAGVSYVNPAFVGQHAALTRTQGQKRRGVTTTGASVVVEEYGALP